jgi:hypothetical protein
MSLQHIEDARRADATAEFTPGQSTDCRTAGTELERLVIAIERQGYCAARAIRPTLRAQGATGPDPSNESPPLVLFQRPGFGDTHQRARRLR